MTASLSSKSSLLATLFRLYEVEGDILIDGKNIRDLPRQTLRSSMTIIPQAPLLLELSIRENLDMEGVVDDAEIWAALEQTECKAWIESLPGGLDHVAVSGSAWSRGQRQLLALSRALLRKRKILCLDECVFLVDDCSRI